MNNKKISVKLFSVHPTFMVKFILMLNYTNDPNDFKNQALIKTSFNGYDTYTLKLTKMVVLDITPKNGYGENWSRNNTISFLDIQLYNLIKTLERIYRLFTTEKELFYYDEKNNLIVNKEKAEKYKTTVVGCSNSSMLIQFCVVDVENSQYEGVVICINSYNYYSYLTYSELDYLITELKKINTSQLAASALNTLLISDQELRNSFSK